MGFFDFLRKRKQLTPEQKAANFAAQRERLEQRLAPEHEAARRAARDNTNRINYYADSGDPAAWARWEAAGRPFIDVTDIDGPNGWHKFATPPPTPEQWAKLTPEQKANTANPVLPEDLPA